MRTHAETTPDPSAVLLAGQRKPQIQLANRTQDITALYPNFDNLILLSCYLSGKYLMGSIY